MKTDLPDVNLLVALHFEDHQHHAVASEWFGSSVRFATTPITELGFVRVSMNPAVAEQPFSAEEALEALRRLRAVPRADFWADDTSITSSAVAARVLSGHRQVTDLHLLALAASRSGRLVTFDARVGASLTVSESRHLRVLGARGA
ncbi:MAG: PIN domain-containing protein [Microbacterium sp.]